MQQLCSHLPLPVSTARVARPSAPFSWLPAGMAGVANLVPSTYLGQVVAPLPLRSFLRREIGELLSNNQPKCAPPAGPAPRDAGFAVTPWHGRYQAVMASCG